MTDTEKNRYLLDSLTDEDVEIMGQKIDAILDGTYTDNKTKH